MTAKNHFQFNDLSRSTILRFRAFGISNLRVVIGALSCPPARSPPLRGQGTPCQPHYHTNCEQSSKRAIYRAGRCISAIKHRPGPTDYVSLSTPSRTENSSPSSRGRYRRGEFNVARPSETIRPNGRKFGTSYASRVH